MIQEAPLLRSSFELALAREPDLVRFFYDHLFERHPELAPMFEGRPRVVQQQMFLTTFRAILDNLDDVDWLYRKLGAMGERHLAYGVTASTYDAVRESMLATLENANDEWSPTLESAWTLAFNTLAKVMLAGRSERASA